MAIHRQPEIATMAEALSYLGLGSAADDNAIAQLQSIKHTAESVIRRYLGCNITRATYTHYLPRGNPFDLRVTGPRLSLDGGSEYRQYTGSDLFLPQYPIRSIDAIYEDADGRFGQVSDAFDADSLLTAGTDYYWPEEAAGFGRIGVVRRIDTLWCATPGSIKATYTAGWTQHELHGDTDDPETDASLIRSGVLKTIAEFWSDRSIAGSTSSGAPGPIKQESIGGYQVTYATEMSGVAVQLPMDVQVQLQPFRRLASVRAMQ
jgi:hypothetical protein